MKGNTELDINRSTRPKVLLLGNGLLRMAGGRNWSELLGEVKQTEVEKKVLSKVPYSMQPELLRGVGIEKLRQELGSELQKVSPAISEQLKKLIALDFDCVLTTNYGYEVETILLQKEFNANQRQKHIRTYENSRKQINLQLCYEMEKDGKPLPVWHIHGDAMRPSSLILSYHSYAKNLASLWQYSGERLKNKYEECQKAGKPLPVNSWLEWFLAGDVYSVGFGWDFSEIDLWWVMERCARERGITGTRHIYFFDSEDYSAKAALLEQMSAKVHVIENRGWYTPGDYERMIEAVAREIFPKITPSTTPQ